MERPKSSSSSKVKAGADLKASQTEPTKWVVFLAVWARSGSTERENSEFPTDSKNRLFDQKKHRLLHCEKYGKR